ncbi:exopolysaccharide biosynthesis polyprenyl glycosylphosphotransferase [Psychroflexus planctonicus]|uniref:Undecaprenyl-phosphate glucose phosphotransferase n=1 Tax=Psychroflexus planctonicus TaxID=1526575 RepID=A0ABQ1SGK6_9FLAO|nr:exopolysaccharide biosynthesis polyprenyl glycosylphosphotransferase [Psychroflexus planctonicus]GGE33694.1 undecaprenyl-phosphate glucose phosphotransferase [Psychroflexus planctonicus]
MGSKVGRYSGYLRPLTFVVDWTILITFAYYFNFETEQWFYFSIFSVFSWIILSLKTDYYEVYRFTKTLRIISLSVTQFVVFTLVVFFYFKVFNLNEYSTPEIFDYLGRIFLLIFLFKLGTYLFLKKYRSVFGKNYRRTVIIGDTLKSNQLKDFFVANPEFGYKFMKQFSVEDINKQNLQLQKCFDYIIQEDIDEIYCSTSDLEDESINEIIDFADNNLKVLKFLPDNRDIYAKRLKIDYYGYLPILSLRTIPIEEPINLYLKRVFDIIVSSLVIAGILSWLTPILAILIKVESKGPVFFKQKRNGLDYKEFYCFKFRSMKPNPEADIHQVRKNDVRITKIGKFLRKTSIDELPQFFNVFLGEMSVVGPRPHMVSHTHMYAERIDKFMVRHFVKPGITGLAQVSGFRGEVETDHDIISRVKFDIFYLENWSILLDAKIIFLTILNAVKGDRKAY